MNNQEEAIKQIVENAFPGIKPVNYLDGSCTLAGEPGEAQIVVRMGRDTPLSRLIKNKED